MEIFTQPSDIIRQLDIVPGMKVGDLGVGSGHYTKAFAEVVGDDGMVFAIDIQQDILKRLESDLQKFDIQNVQYIWGDIDRPRGTQLADNLLDIAVLSNTLFQIEDKPACLTEIKRICKPSAEVLFVDWTDSHGGLGPQQEQIVSPEQAQKLFQEAGFVFYKNIETGQHHYAHVYKLTSR